MSAMIPFTIKYQNVKGINTYIMTYMKNFVKEILLNANTDKNKNTQPSLR